MFLRIWGRFASGQSTFERLHIATCRGFRRNIRFSVESTPRCDGALSCDGGAATFFKGNMLQACADFFAIGSGLRHDGGPISGACLAHVCMLACTHVCTGHAGVGRVRLDQSNFEMLSILICHSVENGLFGGVHATLRHVAPRCAALCSCAASGHVIISKAKCSWSGRYL